MVVSDALVRLETQLLVHPSPAILINTDNVKSKQYFHKARKATICFSLFQETRCRVVSGNRMILVRKIEMRAVCSKKHHNDYSLFFLSPAAFNTNSRINPFASYNLADSECATSSVGKR